MHIDPSGYYRNSLPAALSGDYAAHGDLKQADCIIGAAFGARSDGGVGKSNQALANYISGLPLQVPWIVQQEIAHAIHSDSPANTIRLHTISQARQTGQRLDTLEFLEQAHNYMRQHNYEVAVLAGHPNHIPWLDFLCQQLGIKTVVPHGLSAVPFDPASSQAWTRSLEAWQAEVLGRQAAGNERSALS